jgi:Fe2+ or Zn2+ uptake regulation protein
LHIPGVYWNRKEGGAMPRTKEKENYRARLKAVGLRHTLPRERILSFLDKKNVHPTPEELYQGLKKRGYDIGLSTVYLNLHVLREHGLIYEFKDPKGYTRYDGYTEPHIHLVCTSCGKVEDFLLKNLPELDLSPAMQAAAERSGWALEGFRLEFRGKCPNCQK